MSPFFTFQATQGAISPAGAALPREGDHYPLDVNGPTDTLRSVTPLPWGLEAKPSSLHRI